MTHAIKLWFFVIGLSSFIIIGSITVHEFGHAVAGVSLGCDIESITLYAQGTNPNTNIRCSDNIANVLVSLAGMTFNILFGIIFLFAERPIINKMAYMFFGFGLYSGKMDLQSIGFPVIISSLVSLVGICLIIYSLYLLCKIEILELFKSKQVVAS